MSEGLKKQARKPISGVSLALALDPAMAKAYFNMGDIYKSREKYADAILSYQQGLQIEPENSRVRKNLTRTLEAAQNR